MATTAKDIIQAAVGSRTANDPNRLGKKPELVNVLSRRVQALYALAAKTNPWYFTTQETVTPDGSKWPRPATASNVLWVYGGGAAGDGSARVLTGTDPEDDRVHIVPFREQAVEVPPRIYQLGRDFYSVGATGDPSASTDGDVLTFVHSFLHGALDPTEDWDAAANTLDDSWPEHHNNLLVAHLERYLAKKDGRQGDVALLSSDIEELEALFVAELESDVGGITSRHRAPGSAGA